MSARWDAEDYAKNSRAQLAWARSNLDRLRLSGHESVLDVGCGDGKITVEIASRVPSGRAVGVDKSPEMIALAERTHGSRDRVSFRLADAAALAFVDEFDVVFSNSTLHWVADHPAVLRGLRRALRDRGRIFLSMGGRGTAAAVLEEIAALRVQAPWSAFLADRDVPYHFFGVDDYASWLPAAGFTPRRVELVPREMRHEDLAALEGWLRTTWMPYTERIPVDRRASFLSELAQRIAARCRGAGGDGIVLPMVNLEVEADVGEKPA